MITARAATAVDAPLLFAWRNDPDTRAASLDHGEVGWDEHVAWVDRVTADEATQLYVIESDGVPIGTCRFDTVDDSAEVSITVAPEARGKGLGRSILAAAIERFAWDARDRPPLTATVRESNSASIRLFTAAGFELTGVDSEAGINFYRG